MPTFSRRIWRLLAGYGATSAGSGFVYTYLFVYLAQARGLGPAAAGAVLAALAASGGLILPLAGWLGDRIGPARVTAAALLLSACGSLVLALAHTTGSALTGAILWGAGLATTWNGLAAIWGGAVPEEERAGVFATNNVTQNIGWGVGGAAGALFAHLALPASFVPGFLGDAVLRAAFAALILATGWRTATPRRSRLPPARLSRPLIALTALSTLVMAAAFSQTTSAFPAWATATTGSTAIVGLAVGLGCLAIVLAQFPVLRLLQAAGPARRLPMAALGMALFAAAWLLALPGRRPELVASMVVFGLGECFYTPVMLAAVNDLAPEGARARYNAVFNLSYQIGPVIGPAVAGAVLAAGDGAALFVGLAAACVLAGAAALVMERLTVSRQPT